MRRYFFEIAKDGHQSPANEGLELSSVQEAWIEATMACGEMIRDMNGSLDPGSALQMTVVDETGRNLFRLTFTTEALG
jgi:hypothetical protein